MIVVVLQFYIMQNILCGVTCLLLISFGHMISLFSIPEKYQK